MVALDTQFKNDLVISEHQLCRICNADKPYLFDISYLKNFITGTTKYPLCKKCIASLTKQFLDYIHG